MNSDDRQFGSRGSGSQRRLPTAARRSVALTFALALIGLAPSTATGRVLTTEDVQRIQSSLRHLVLRVTAQQDLGTETTPLPTAFGFAVALRSGSSVVLVTSLALVTKARTIRITTADDQVFSARVDFRDPDQALAVIAVSDAKRAAILGRKLRTATLAKNGSLRPQTFLYSLVFLPGKQGTQLVMGTLLSTEKGPLYGYWGNDVGIVFGLPLFHFDGRLLAVNFRYGFGSTKLGFSAGVERIRRFLAAYQRFDEQRRKKKSP